MGKTIKGLLSIVGLGGGAKAPKVSGGAAAETDALGKKQKRRRSSLFKTEGDVVGEELAPSQVASKDTLLGN